MFSISCIHRDGKGVDNKISMDWFNKVAERGNINAMFSLVCIYKYMKKDEESATDWLKLAADRISGWNMNRFGCLYRDGDGAVKNNEKAMEWFLKLMKRAMLTLYIIGGMYRDGKAVKKDYETAMDWFLEAAKEGSSCAMYSICCMYRNGKSVDGDNIVAMKWSQDVSERDNSNSMNNIGCMYRDGNSEIKLTEDNNLGTMGDIENLYRCDTDTN
ncbi:HCP-like protein [Rhizopus microsporus var. microsporus]|uniref:HCP-like protein n=2 Tax=Rhizopus microsporus TaxID=58291 RepID=A0A2G4STK3_RHIZD|nr:HCP-like protein [Rhizopus microsporus ATCC 52813]ORE11601.1 HCP-like protein [Rhizopus microsporus var. microsporus]PHZ12103.1 HCP-like protein [Rhizopus microsporus ATCC 52813]